MNPETLWEQRENTCQNWYLLVEKMYLSCAHKTRFPFISPPSRGVVIWTCSNFWGCSECSWSSHVHPFKWEQLSSIFLSCRLQCLTLSSSSNFFCEKNPELWPFKWHLLSSCFQCVFFFSGKVAFLNLKVLRPWRSLVLTSLRETPSIAKICCCFLFCVS